MPDLPQVARERVSEWSPIREGLAQVVDQLKAVQSAVIAAAGAKPPRVNPSPRPVTAVHRVKRAKAKRQHLELVSRVLPPKQ